MHPTAACRCRVRNGIITGGATARGFNDGTKRGYPLLLTLSTRQVSDIVRRSQILIPKGGRLRPDGHMPASEDSNERREAIRHVCTTYYLEEYPDFKAVDPLKDHFPSCTMPFASTTPLTVSPAIMHNREHARDYISHASLVTELLEQSSVPTDPALFEYFCCRV